MNILSQNSRAAGNCIRIASVILIFVMAAISVLVYGAPVRCLVIMSLFLLFYVQLPGLFMIRRAGLGNERISTTLALGLFAGWSFEIALYFISDIIPTDLLLYAGGPVLSALYIWSVVKDRQRGQSTSVLSRVKWDRIPVSFCIFFVLILFYCIVNTQYRYLSPALSDSTYMNPDKAYHLGLINSLSHDYPLQSPWITGIFINYHIFSEMLLSIPVRLFRVSADFTTQSFGPFMTAYTFGLSLYSFFREMTSRPERAGIYSLVVVLSNIYVTRKIFSSLAFNFILINDNSAGYGMAAALMTIVLLKKWYAAFLEKNGDQWALLALCMLFIMLTTGIKGPMGAVTVAALWGTVLLGVILRGMPLRSFIPLGIYTAGFLLVYMTVLGSKGQSNAAGNSVIKFGTITNIAFWKKPLIAFLKSIGIPGPARLLMILLVFAFFFFTVFFLPFIIGYIRELCLVLTKRREYDFTRVLVYAECAVGFVAMFFLNYSGHSQVYFGLVTAFLAPVVAFWLIEDLEDRRQSSRSSRITLRVCSAVMIVTLIFTTCTLAVYFGRHIRSAAGCTDPTIEHDPYLSISNEEYEAMEWIEANTPEDSLLATDRYFSVDPSDYSYENRWDNRFFLYAVYSNRFSYISGSGYNLPAANWPLRKEMIETNSRLYDADYEERGDLARELDVDYVVVSKRFNEPGDLTNEDYELCYSNDDIDIYRIADAS